MGCKGYVRKVGFSLRKARFNLWDVREYVRKVGFSLWEARFNLWDVRFGMRCVRSCM